MDLVLCVEGDGDVRAVPVLIRRVLEERYELYGIKFEVHKRNGLDTLRACGWQRFRRYLQAARIHRAPILWVVDLDDGCAWHVAAEMHAVVREEALDVPFGGAFVVREYESLLLADTASTAAKLGADEAQLRSVTPENVRDAKGVLSDAMPKGRIYKETVHQDSVTAIVNLSEVEKNSRSLRHLMSVIEWLIRSRSGCYPIKAL